MDAMTVVAMVCVGGGMALLATGLVARATNRETALVDILDLPFGPKDQTLATLVDAHGTLVENTIGLAGRVIEQMDPRGGLRNRHRAGSEVPLRPVEFVVVAASVGSHGQPGAGRGHLELDRRHRRACSPCRSSPASSSAPAIRRRTRRFAAQFPDGLMLIASSLSAGHTFLRSVQIMCERRCGAKSVGGVQPGHRRRDRSMGVSVVEALDRMAQRLDVRDVDWVVQAIRIQQEVGGKLAELLETSWPSSSAPGRGRREIDVLTAEGRLSAWVLGALPVFLFFAVEIVQPGYMAPPLRAGACPCSASPWSRWPSG